MKPVVLVLLFAVAIVPAAPQTPPKPAFEVASIKANTSVANRVSVEIGKGRFVATNASLRILLRYAFDPRLPEDEMRRTVYLFSGTSALQTIGGPSWITSDRFDVEAKPPQDHTVVQAEMQSMMQALLEDRFQLKVHREMREVPTYNLIVVKEGKMKVSSNDNSPPATTPQRERLPSLPRGRMWTGVIGRPSTPMIMTTYGNAIPVSELISSLESWAGRPIKDQTNLKGLYDVLFQFSRQQEDASQVAAADPSGPSIFTAIQQELGLKLESSKGSIEVLVIDSVQRPSQN